GLERGVRRREMLFDERVQRLTCVAESLGDVHTHLTGAVLRVQVRDPIEVIGDMDDGGGERIGRHTVWLREADVLPNDLTVYTGLRTSPQQAHPSVSPHKSRVFVTATRLSGSLTEPRTAARRGLHGSERSLGAGIARTPVLQPKTDHTGGGS